MTPTMRLLALPAILSTLAFTAGAAPRSSSSKPLPLLVWHGLGDHYDAEGLQSVGDLANEVYPETFVYYIRINDNGDEDRKATFFGDVNDQISQVCSALQDVPGLKDSTSGLVRADALGFSQGGQFLRALVQRCEGLSVRTLMTFGSQHNGISDVQECGTWDLLCKGAVALMRGNIWTEWVQTNLVPAQYFRSVDDETGEPTEEYLESSRFLADVNNELEEKNATYKARLAELDMLAMFVFEEDGTVIPRETGWFAEVLNAKDEEKRTVVPLRERQMYKEDWLGLRKLDEKKGLACLTTPGDHMQLDEGVMKDAFELYFGPERNSAPGAWKGRTDGCGFTKGSQELDPQREQIPFKQGL